MSGWLKNQAVLITGGGSGLGLALIERFLAEGAMIAVLERSEEKSAALIKRYHGDVVVTTGDVRSIADNQRAVAAAVERFGKLDSFIGNAAVWDHGASLMDTDIEHLDKGFDELFAINVKGYLLGAKAAAPALVKSRGNIIFTLSNSAFYPGGGGPLYTAGKHAAVGLIREIAYELAPHVRVNGVGPCGMATDLRGPEALGQQNEKIMDSRTPEAIASILPLQFLPETSEFTGPFVLLASRENNQTLTGVLINADAGLGIRGIRYVAGGLNLG